MNLKFIEKNINKLLLSTFLIVFSGLIIFIVITNKNNNVGGPVDIEKEKIDKLAMRYLNQLERKVK